MYAGTYLCRKVAPWGVSLRVHFLRLHTTPRMRVGVDKNDLQISPLMGGSLALVALLICALWRAKGAPLLRLRAPVRGMARSPVSPGKPSRDSNFVSTAMLLLPHDSSAFS
jgi:hypothetical protein